MHHRRWMRRQRLTGKGNTIESENKEKKNIETANRLIGSIIIMPSKKKQRSKQVGWTDEQRENYAHAHYVLHHKGPDHPDLQPLVDTLDMDARRMLYAGYFQVYLQEGPPADYLMLAPNDLAQYFTRNHRKD